jgi:hypothetical protein
MCLLHDGFPFVTRKPSHPQWPSSEGPNHRINDRWSALAGVQFQDIGNYSHDFGGRRVELNLD